MIISKFLLFPLLLSRIVFSTALYTTNFALTENPISENKRWQNGATVGLDWQNIQTNGSYAYASGSQGTNYNDSIALLLGNYTGNQVVIGKVRTVNQLQGASTSYNEVELHLRRTITAHSVTGYEIDFSVRGGNGSHDGTQYIECVRWDGAVGSFTIATNQVAGAGLNNNDIVMAKVIGNIITIYINGALQYTVDISSQYNGAQQWVNGSGPSTTGSNGTIYSTGYPGIGVDYGGLNADLITDQGFVSWSADNIY